MKTFLILLNLCCASVCFAQYGSYENHMLNQSMNSFFYYQASPRGFADPRSLRDTEHRAAITVQVGTFVAGPAKAGAASNRPTADKRKRRMERLMA